MRLLSEMSSLQEALSLKWYLLSQGIEAWVDEEGSPSSAGVWVLADDALTEAKHLAVVFSQQKETQAFKTLISQTELEHKKKSKLESKQKAQAYKKNYKNNSVDPGHISTYPVTFTLVAICTLLFLFLQFDKSHNLLAYLTFSNDPYAHMFGQKNFAEIAHGQLWRLVTPAFIHGGIFHIFFNMALLWQLGRAFEQAFSPLRLLGLFLCVAIVSHTAFYLVAGPSFGGMSGVIYGLVAYFWVWDRHGSGSGTGLGQHFGQWFLIWYCVCLGLSLVGVGLANTIHGAGAWVGFLIAYWHSGAYKQARMQLRHSKNFRKEILVGLGLLALAMLVDHYR